MHQRKLIGTALVGSAAVILLAIIPTALMPPVALGSDLTGCSELIVNGGFEQGGVGWQQQASPPLPSGVTLVDPFFPHTGTLGAYLAGRNGAADRLSQAIALPPVPAESRLAFSFWWALSTQEDAGAFDFMKVELYNASSGALVASVLTADNTRAADWTWTSEAFDLTPYAGQTVMLRFAATNDATGSPTAFFVDDVSLSRCDFPLSPTPTLTVTPRPTATSTASPSATATATRTPTYTPTISPTATTSPTGSITATLTATLRQRALYLPLVIQETG